MSAISYKKMLNHIIKQMPDIAGWKDLNSTIRGCNAQTAYWLGYDNPHDIVGVREDKLRYPDVDKLSPIFLSYDEKAYNINNVMQTLHYMRAHGDSQYKLMFIQKKPIVDFSNKTIGLLFTGMHDASIVFKQLSQFLFDVTRYYQEKHIAHLHYWIGDKNTLKSHSLSKRQAECLFFTLRGNTARDIARKLNISPKTVESHIENIRWIFSCDTKSELINQAIAEGYMNMIPELIFEKLA